MNAQLYSLLDPPICLLQKQMETSEHTNARTADLQLALYFSVCFKAVILNAWAVAKFTSRSYSVVDLMYLGVDLDSLLLSPEGCVVRPF